MWLAMAGSSYGCPTTAVALEEQSHSFFWEWQGRSWGINNVSSIYQKQIKIQKKVLSGTWRHRKYNPVIPQIVYTLLPPLQMQTLLWRAPLLRKIRYLTLFPSTTAVSLAESQPASIQAHLQLCTGRCQSLYHLGQGLAFSSSCYKFLNRNTIFCHKHSCIVNICTLLLFPEA